jgi:hypothetical protein
MAKKSLPRAGAPGGPDLLLAAICHPATFRDLEARLRERLAARVRRGEISERQLALRTGYTQPHVHNVLKGARGFRAGLADALLESLHMSVWDLIGDRPTPEGQAAAPLWAGLVGPRHRFPTGTQLAGERLFPASFLARFGSPALMRLAAEEDGMSPLVEPGDLVLADRGERARRQPVFEGIYALALGSQGAVCRCQVVGSALVLVADNGRRAYRLPDHLPLERRDLLDIVRGRIVWTSRDLE